MAVSRSRSDVRTLVLREDLDQPPERQSRFFVRPLTNAQLAALQNQVMMRTDGGIVLNRGTQRYLLLKCGLTGWDNYADSDGRPAPFDVDVGKRRVQGIEIDGPPSDETLERMAIEHWNELADEIQQMNVLTPDDAKN